MRKMNTWVVPFIMIAMVPVFGVARLGETERQSLSRYGKPTDTSLDKNSPVLAGTVSRTYPHPSRPLMIITKQLDDITRPLFDAKIQASADKIRALMEE